MLQGWFEAPIQVIPAVDVLGDEAVRLRKGDYDAVVARASDPSGLAASFARAGAVRIHLVDLDGARNGVVRPAIVRSVADASGVAVQASGGIRSLRDADALLDAGADRVVVGTAAFPDPSPWVRALGDRLIVALDERGDEIRASGWTTTAGVGVGDAVARCRDAGVVRVLCTAIVRDGTLAGPDVALVERVAASGLAVLAAGGIRSPSDVGALAAAGAEAAVVGRALYTHS